MDDEEALIEAAYEATGVRKHHRSQALMIVAIAFAGVLTVALVVAGATGWSGI